MKTKSNEMKIKQRLISMLGTKVNLDLFYCIRFDASSITLQGYITNDVVSILSSIELPLVYNEDAKWLEGSRGCIRIVLTPNVW